MSELEFEKLVTKTGVGREESGVISKSLRKERSQSLKRIERIEKEVKDEIRSR